MFRRRSMTFVLSATAAATALLFTGVAGAEPVPEKEGKYCATLLAKGKPGEASPVVTRHCSDTKEVAEAAVFSVSADSTWLGSVSEHEFQQGEEEMYFGDSGPCDAEGYRVDWIRWELQNKTSSFLGWNNCNYVTLYDNSNADPSAGYWSAADLGFNYTIVDELPDFNDRASSLRFRNL
ncbi:hypothetical protein L3Q67_00245 [Saccharothrix sp. AJ9571]|nr:hypothetical protein L3Q67_00245 [Saccharothrix sp. AJ9571]